MEENCMKEGISEKMKIEDQKAHKRNDTSQKPPSPAGEKVSREGKSFTIK